MTDCLCNLFRLGGPGTLSVMGLCEGFSLRVTVTANGPLVRPDEQSSISLSSSHFTIYILPYFHPAVEYCI